MLGCADYLIPGALTSWEGPLGAETHISEAGNTLGKQTGVPKEIGLSSRAEMRPLPSSSLCQGTWSLCPWSIWGFSPELGFSETEQGPELRCECQGGLWCGDAVPCLAPRPGRWVPQFTAKK